MASFSGKLIVITGAASGIGKATSKLLASRGALLSLSDISEAGLKSVHDEISGAASDAGLSHNILTQSLDVRSAEACNAWIERTVSHFKMPIYGAANMAGITGQPSLLRDNPASDFDAIWDVNIKGIVNSLRAQLPHLQKGIDGRGGGAIVNASSLSGLIGLPTYGPYVTSKFAVIGITRTAAKEEGPNGIRVNAIAP
jgi:NAD(P)-dependent dehydrogenase (short-subunit alcohol dehydrogenase family)